MRKQFAGWIYQLSAALHFALYPLSLAAIGFLFWKLGFWEGLVGMLLVTLAAVIFKFGMLAVFSTVITLLDPQFFS